MIIRKAMYGDIKKINEIYTEARGTIALLGIDQWQNGYPAEEDVIFDIKKSYLNVVADENNIYAVFALLTDGEKTYDKIYDGEWNSGETENYIALHRFAISVSARGRGIASQIISHAEDVGKSLGMKSMRIDTHEGNVVMRKMLEKNGFTHCGTIFLESGEKRVAYEKLINYGREQ